MVHLPDVINSFLDLPPHSTRRRADGGPVLAGMLGFRENPYRAEGLGNCEKMNRLRRTEFIPFYD
jgi:hypothetical protein